MHNTSITLIPTTTVGTITGNYDGSSTLFHSDSVKGDGYYGDQDGVHTVSYSAAGLTASLVMQGTLIAQPSDADWFDIGNTSLVCENTTDIQSFNFIGNFVWVRCKVGNFTSGTINKVMFNRS